MACRALDDKLRRTWIGTEFFRHLDGGAKKIHETHKMALHRFEIPVSVI
jgi:hypothetical protein